MERAAHIFTQALGSWGETAQALCALGINAAILGFSDEAEENLRHAVALKPDYSWAHYCLGVVYSDRGKPREAVDHLKIAHSGMPDSLRIARALGKACVAAGDADAALAAFQEAVTRRSGSPAAARLYLEMGNACHLLGRPKEARRAFERALEIDPCMLTALRNLGTLRLRAGAVDGAIEVLERAAEIDPDHVKTLHKLALAWFQKGDQARAETLMRRVLEMHGTSGEGAAAQGRARDEGGGSGDESLESDLGGAR